MKNLIVNGDINTNKTSGVIFPIVSEMIKNKESFLVTDSKKEYYNNFKDEVIKKGYNVKVINIDNPSLSDSFNLFEIPYNLYKNGKKDEAFRLLETMIQSLYVTDGNMDPFWNISSSTLVLSIVMKLFEEADEKEINLKSVYNMLTKFSNFDNKLLNSYFKLGSSNKAYIGASDILNYPSETRGSIIAVAKQTLYDSVIYDDTLSMISNGDFSLSDKPLALFIITSNSDYLKNRLFNIILQDVLYLCKNDDDKFNVVLDNYDELSTINLRELLSSSISYNTRVIVGTRDFEKINSSYSNYLSKVSDIVDTNKEKIEGKKIEGKKMELPKNNIREVKVFDIYKHLSSDLIKMVGSVN